MRVVFDTSVLVAAARSRDGLSFCFGRFDQMWNFGSALKETIEESCELVEVSGIDPGSGDFVQSFVKDRFWEALDA